MATAKKAAKKKKKKFLKKLLRAYKGPDYYLTEQSQALCDLFEDDQPDFEAFDSTYADPFRVDVWQAAIDAAVNYKDDSTVVAEVQAKSDEVEVLMKAGRDKYSEIMYFAQNAFGKTNVILKQFGKGAVYKAASRSQGRMFNFLDELSQAANKHKVKLGTVNCTQAIIDSIGTVRDSFNTGNRDQNAMKADRPEISQGRVIVNNALYKITTQVIGATKSVYKNDPAKLGQYVYNPPIHHRDKVVIEFDAEPAVITQINPTGVDMDEIATIVFESVDSSFVVYGAPAAGMEPGAFILLVADGNTIQHTPAELATLLHIDETNSVLCAKNVGTETGHFTATFIKN